MQKVEINGVETEVYTAAERDADIVAARTAVEGEWKPKFEKAAGDLTAAQKAAADRAGEFKQFRELSEEQVAQLAEKDRIIYNNGLALKAAQDKADASVKVVRDGAIDAAIRAKTGSDEKLFTETKKMYGLLTLDDTTPAGISQRAAAALGALGGTQPDLLASAGFGGGGHIPPAQGPESTSYADTPEGEAAAKLLGVITKLPKQQ